MFEGFERKVVPVDGLDIACAVGGKGVPVPFLHCFPQTMAMWARMPQGWSRQLVHGRPIPPSTGRSNSRRGLEIRIERYPPIAAVTLFSTFGCALQAPAIDYVSDS
jgi:hypothetical protein